MRYEVHGAGNVCAKASTIVEGGKSEGLRSVESFDRWEVLGASDGGRWFSFVLYWQIGRIVQRSAFDVRQRESVFGLVNFGS